MPQKRPIGFGAYKEDDNNQEDAKAPLFDPAILTFFSQHYKPAEDFKTADTYMTTDEIMQELDDHMGGSHMTRSDLYAWLKENHYREEPLEGMKIVWLLKRTEL